MTTSHQMEDKVAIVTGSSSGIGEAIALLFTKNGASLTICGRNASRLQSVKDKCLEITGNVDRFLVIQGDQNDPVIRSKTIQDTVDRFGKLDILVANAGEVNIFTTFMDETEESFDKCFNILVKSVVFLVKEAVPHLEKNKGSIAIVSSPSATCCVGGQFPYAIAKAAVEALTKILAFGLGGKGIRVNAIRPGYTPTNIIRDFCQEEDVANLNTMFVETNRAIGVLKDRVTSSEEQAGVVGFLVSDEAAFITGESILTDAAASLVRPCFNQTF